MSHLAPITSLSYLSYRSNAFIKSKNSYFKSFLALLSITLFSFSQASISAQLPDFVELVEKSQPSVVSISTTVKVRQRNFFSRRPSSGSSRGPSGSGFIISKDGYVITNNHVVEGVDKVFVRLHNGNDLEAEIVGTDAETDIALLKISEKNLTPLEIGDVESTKVGSWVVAIGAPFGYEQTVTAGIVSAKSRSVGEQYIPYIQTDVAINPGNSGGPLIDMNGKVIGINSKILSTSGGSNGLSFSIPIDLAMDVVGQLKDDGIVVRGYLGVNYQEVSYELAKSFGLKRSRGALINHVAPDSPADKAGLKAGDIVLKINKKAIKNHSELPFVVGRYRPGDSVKMHIVRGRDKLIKKVTIGSRTGEQVASNSELPKSGKVDWLGAELKNIPDEIIKRSNIQNGVMVTRVEQGAVADAGIREGDIIQSVQLSSTSNLIEFKRIIESLPKSGSVPVLVNRPGSGAQYVILDID
ncbi:MAG: serine peptidase [Gammaproteobacteria bacterium]|nr:MAG: serine peptidase [Gammaproteobacteria bacterium]